MLAMSLSLYVWGCGGGRWLVGLHEAVLRKIAFHVLWIWRIRGEQLGEPQSTLNKAKCHQKVASSAIALQGDRNTSQTPEVKEQISGEEENLVVPRDGIIQTTQGTIQSYNNETSHIHTIFPLAAEEL